MLHAPLTRLSQPAATKSHAGYQVAIANWALPGGRSAPL